MNAHFPLRAASPVNGGVLALAITGADEKRPFRQTNHDPQWPSTHRQTVTRMLVIAT